MGDAVCWDRKEYSREVAVMISDVFQFILALDEDDREYVKKQRHIVFLALLLGSFKHLHLNYISDKNQNHILTLLRTKRPPNS